MDKAEPIDGTALADAPDDNRCPGCGILVPCGIAAGGTTCWCMAESDVAASSAAVRLPLPAVGARCYCPACLEKRKAGVPPG